MKKVICYIIGALASVLGVLPAVYRGDILTIGAALAVVLFFFACAFDDGLAKKVSFYAAGGLSVLYAIIAVLAVLSTQNLLLGIVVLFYAGLAVPSFIFGNDTEAI